MSQMDKDDTSNEPRGSPSKGTVIHQVRQDLRNILSNFGVQVQFIRLRKSILFRLVSNECDPRVQFLKFDRFEGLNRTSRYIIICRNNWSIHHILF